MRAWYVVNTLPHQESRADQNLRRQSFTTLLPVTRRTRRHARRLDTVLTPLFPGYLFVELDLDNQSWSSINSTFGVKRLLCSGERPTELQRDFVAALQETVDEDGHRERSGARTAARPAGAHIVGAVRRLQSRPVLHLSPGERVKLLLNVLGGSVSATMPQRGVVPL